MFHNSSASSRIQNLVILCVKVVVSRCGMSYHNEWVVCHNYKLRIFFKLGKTECVLKKAFSNYRLKIDCFFFIKL